MSVAVSMRRARRTVLTKHWVATLAGIVIAGVTTVGTIYYYGLGLSLQTVAGGALGGFVTGVLLGTNSIDAGALGFRAGTIGGAIATVLFGAFLLVVWFIDSGQAFLQVSFMYVSLTFMVYVPLNGVTGAFGGALGTALRRLILPPRYNPPPY